MNPWRYFTQIASEIEDISRIISITEENISAFGDKIAECIIVTGTEIDTNLRILTDGGHDGNMKSYKNWLLANNRNIQKLTMRIPTQSGGFIPFDHLEDNRSYDWWKIYTSIKHNRYENAMSANIGNLLKIHAAHYVVNLYATYRYKYLFNHGLGKAIVFPLVMTHNYMLGRTLLYYKNDLLQDGIFDPNDEYFNTQLPCQD